MSTAAVSMSIPPSHHRIDTIRLVLDGQRAAFAGGENLRVCPDPHWVFPDPLCDAPGRCSGSTGLPAEPVRCSARFANRWWPVGARPGLILNRISGFGSGFRARIRGRRFGGSCLDPADHVPILPSIDHASIRIVAAPALRQGARGSAGVTVSAYTRYMATGEGAATVQDVRRWEAVFPLVRDQWSRIQVEEWTRGFAVAKAEYDLLRSYDRKWVTAGEGGGVSWE